MPYRKVGVDLGLRGPHYITVADEAGRLVRPLLTAGTSADDFDCLYAHALDGAEDGTQLKIIFEPTALRWLPLAIYSRAQKATWSIASRPSSFTTCAPSMSGIAKTMRWIPRPGRKCPTRFWKSFICRRAIMRR